MNTDGISGHRKEIENLEYFIQKNSIPNSILFTGISGIGKRMIAKRFVKALFCEDINGPCLICKTCIQIRHGSFPDLIEIGPNEKGVIPIGKEERLEPGTVRWLIDKLTKKSIYGRTAVIIDSFDRITEEGQNALLKTTEEPSLDAYFILISSNRARILPTILSRCSELRFNPLSDNEISEIFKIQNIETKDADLIASISGGSFETAMILSDEKILDEIIRICGEISSFKTSKDLFDTDLSPLQKEIGLQKTLDIIISIFRLNLMAIINNKMPENPFFRKLFIDDIDFLKHIIKILLAMKKGESQNINIKHSLKGMLYSFKLNDIKDIPLLNSYR